MTDNLYVSKIGDKYIIGKENITHHCQGVKSPSSVEPILRIPAVIDGNVIEEIGCGAFWRCSKLVEVIIEDGIKQINERAFSDCYNLVSISIPKSVIFFGTFCIHCYNFSLLEINSSLSSDAYNGKGTLRVSFARGSLINFLNSSSITRKEKIIIYYWENKSPSFSGDPFFLFCGIKVKIFAPFVKKFGGLATRNYKTFYNKKESINYFLLIICLILR